MSDKLRQNFRSYVRALTKRAILGDLEAVQALGALVLAMQFRV